jgi:hypothetical protein
VFWVEGDQGCPIFVKKIIPVWQLWNKAPSLALAAVATTNVMIDEFVWNTPFNCMGLLSFGIQPMKKCPHALLWAPVSER